ncbi:TraB/VirB10 family protein [Thalassotalea piscium]|uniref:Conjugal transfer pilus assembly protein TraB n=1 Tax=Thalassotalea piscium TaxID=1230533 RepID=A0A7X0TTD7_9GAMM|nr:TraB/VirB10 family protein [Thalassotalea piscium]MBB6543043.1 conjugal transfer pilus assembly protein TraB [Thalassotalea piscium]
MLDKIKSNWAMLKPQHKTFAMWGGGFIALALSIFFFSQEPIKKEIKIVKESTTGLYEVGDEALSIEDLGTKQNAQDKQMETLQNQIKALQNQAVKDREIIKTLSGSDKSIRTLNEIGKKVNRLEQAFGDLSNKQELLGGFSPSDGYVEVEDIIKEAEQGKDEQGKDEQGKDGVDIASSRKLKAQTLINNTVKKSKVPEDPLAFIKSVSSEAKVKTDQRNEFLPDETVADPKSNYKRPGNIMLVTSQEEDVVSSEKESESSYVGERLLAGSLIPVVVVSGVDAPTGKAAEKGAISSTLRVTGPVILPNNKRVDLTGCLITTDVRGDTATERAYFRPNRMTCSFDYGSLDVALKGYVSGKDGVQGFRGKVVSKQGKALLYGTITGAVEGIGKAFGGGGSNQRLGFGGTTGDPFAMPTGKQVGQSAIAGSVSDSAEFLSDYYKNKLDSLYEIIEIKPLITGSVHVLETLQLKLLEDLYENQKRAKK